MMGIGGDSLPKLGDNKRRQKKYTSPLESAMRKKIDQWLSNLGWNTNEESPLCNVTTERPLTGDQKKQLLGKRPDYILYRSNTTEIIATIEAKSKGEDLGKAMEAAIDKYIRPLSVPIAFITDGVFFKTIHSASGKPLIIDSEPVNTLLKEDTIIRFISEGPEIISESPKVQYTREQLIALFRWTNDQLRKEGLREGVERFTEFSNLLFLKLISEIEDEREKSGEKRSLERKYCWDAFSKKPAEDMLDYINDTILPRLVDKYNDSGDVFQSKLGFTNSTTLKAIVDRLSKLDLINVDSDVKGDAFEYFLKDSITVGNDLGEYFTPRHIVRLMVDLIDPQFGETVYDPTCGTGGFLIEAFRHIQRACKPTKETLEILERKTVYGRELTNTARIAKMNMILTGDGHTNVEQCDTLQKPVSEKFDIVLANLPFSQETDWGHLYEVESGQADCVFVQHIMKALIPDGRAAVIVPEGFVANTGVNQKVRELLLKRFVVDSIVSLPAGVFNPYTGSKTDILFFRKTGGSTKKVWFYDVRADGFDLGATRRPVDQNDLPDLRMRWIEKLESDMSWWASIETIENNDWMLVANLYRPKEKPRETKMDVQAAIDQILERNNAISKELKDLKTKVATSGLL